MGTRVKSNILTPIIACRQLHIKYEQLNLVDSTFDLKVKISLAVKKKDKFALALHLKYKILVIFLI